MPEIVRSSQFESLFTAWNLPFELIPDVEIDSIKREESAQVRLIQHRANPETVERYVTKLRAGSEPPPVVVWAEQNWLIDGNTRIEAAKKVGRTTVNVYRVSLPFLTMAKALAGTLNDHGQPLDPAERRAVALDMIELQFSDAQIASALGVTAESARQYRRLQQVAERAERTGTADQVAKLNKTNRMALSKITHDEPFRELALAVADGKPDAKEVREVADRVASATSDDAALEVISQARQEWVPIGPKPRRTMVNRKAQQARMHLGGLLALAPQEVVETAKAADDAVKWQAIVSMAEQVLLLLSAERQGDAE